MPRPLGGRRVPQTPTTVTEEENASEQEKRSRDIADTTRRYLTALNTGGVAITFAVAGTLAGRGVDPRWTIWPVATFVLGLTITASSLLLAKHKALRRRDAAAAGQSLPNFNRWYWANFTYEILALITFLVAVSIDLWMLGRVHLPVE